MKLKLILSTLIFFLAVAASLSQFFAPRSYAVPITGPITSPLIKLSGVVRFLDKNSHRFMPLAGASVEATNNKTGDTFSDNTDGDGVYMLQVPEGKYDVQVTSLLPGYKFVPRLRHFPAFRDFSNLNFYGVPSH